MDKLPNNPSDEDLTSLYRSLLDRNGVYSVYCDNDAEYSWTALKDSDEGRRHEELGRLVVLEGIKGRMNAWGEAANLYLLQPADYVDHMHPKRIAEPTSLFRSVSPEELSDILESGKISGGGNSFNWWERRPWVFFSPEPNEACIWQGEDITRAANYAAVQGLDPDVMGFEAACEESRRRYEVNVERLRDERASADFTAAVIKTAPVSIGFHYSIKHGKTGMNGDDEYGLFPGHIHVHDIEEIQLVKDAKIIERISVEDAQRLFPSEKPSTSTFCI